MQGGQVALDGIKLEGSRAVRARFGSVVASPGDLNLDGYNGLYPFVFIQRLLN